jgi:predicted TIM-barrel fold metal-dependent hydrolase
MNKVSINPQIKKILDKGLHVYDIHTHIDDIISGNKNRETCEFHQHKDTYLEPSLLEKLDFKPTALRILFFLFKYFPFYIKKQIRKNFLSNSYYQLKKQMDECGVSRSVILPTTAIDINKEDYDKNSDYLIFFGSIDIHKTDKENIRGILLNQIDKYKIKGIKLHPNIQKYYPHPSRNNKEISDKLIELYKIINDLKLVVLIHSGISFLPDVNNFSKYDYANLEYFYPIDKKGDNFFSLIHNPIILAHLGCYNSLSRDFSKQKYILRKYNNVYLDTSGQGSYMIKCCIDQCGELALDRLIFGSDALYFNMPLAMDHTIVALSKSLGNISLDEKIEKVFSKNASSLLV